MHLVHEDPEDPDMAPLRCSKYWRKEVRVFEDVSRMVHLYNQGPSHFHVALLRSQSPLTGGVGLSHCVCSLVAGHPSDAADLPAGVSASETEADAAGCRGVPWGASVEPRYGWGDRGWRGRVGVLGLT